MTKKARKHTSKLLGELLHAIDPKEKIKVQRRMLLAAKIADALQAKGWSQSELAQKLGKYDSEITKWLSGTHNFTVDTLFEIQDALEVTLVPLEREPVTLSQTIHLNTSLRVAEEAGAFAHWDFVEALPSVTTRAYKANVGYGYVVVDSGITLDSFAEVKKNKDKGSLLFHG